MAKKNIFIVGLDDFNKRFLEALPEAQECDFHAALDYSEIRDVECFNMKELISKAVERMESFEGSIDGVASYYDFPGTDLVPVLAERFNLPGPSLESVLKCEHKYWSRLEQKKVVPEHITEFQAFDPFDEKVFEKIELEPSYWIKPIKSFKSFMCFRIDNEQDFNEAINKMRKRVGFMCEPFTYFIKKYAQLPPELSDLKKICLAEYPMGGDYQVTLEGHCFQGEAVVYGIVDSIREKDGTSFGRYQYPSGLPLEIEQKMIDIARKIMLHIGLDNSPFNIEFFYDQTKDHIYLLEINPRVSQAHTEIFSKVHGYSHFSVMVDLCLGRKPPVMEKKGSFNVAGHFMVRHFEDGVVASVPSQEDIKKVHEKFPETDIKILVKEGDRLSELVSVQNSYSFELANIFVGGRDEQDMLEKYQAILDMLPLKIEKPE
ncbi:MAG: acetyl-CoA carboxylase biotin carboxylase subunit family protein [Desulfonatronovibrio sp.]